MQFLGLERTMSRIAVCRCNIGTIVGLRERRRVSRPKGDKILEAGTSGAVDESAML